MKAKQKFYHIDELNVYVRLDSITSFKLEKPAKGWSDDYLKCCVIADKSIYWCDSKHFDLIKQQLQ